MDHSDKNATIQRRVFRNTFANYIGQFLTLGIGFLLTPFILARLGSTAYGLWALVGSLAAYGALFDFGIWTAVIKYVSQHYARGEYEEAHSMIATALRLYILVGVLVIAVSAVVAVVFPGLFHVPAADREMAQRLVLVTGIGIGITIPSVMTSAVLQGLHRFDLSNSITVVGTLLVSVCTVAVLLAGGGVVAMAAVTIPCTLLMQIPSIWLVNRVAPELRFGLRGAKLSSARQVASFSASMFVVKVAGQLETKTDQMVIGAFLPFSAITPYTVAQRLSQLPYMLTNQFVRVVLPLASELHAENDWGRLRGLYTTSTRLTLAIFVPIALVVVVLSRPLLNLWVGPAYSDNAYLVGVLALAGLLDATSWAAGSVLQGTAQHRPLAVMAMISGVTNLALSLALVRPFGAAGVAFGTLIPMALVSLGFVLPYVMRKLRIGLREIVRDVALPALLPAIPAALVLYFLQQVIEPASLFAVAFIGANGLLAYAVGYLAVGASDFERQAYRYLALTTWRSALHYVRRFKPHAT